MAQSEVLVLLSLLTTAECGRPPPTLLLERLTNASFAPILLVMSDVTLDRLCWEVRCWWCADELPGLPPELISKFVPRSKALLSKMAAGGILNLILSSNSLNVVR